MTTCTDRDVILAAEVPALDTAQAARVAADWFALVMQRNTDDERVPLTLNSEDAETLAFVLFDLQRRTADMVEIIRAPVG